MSLVRAEFRGVHDNSDQLNIVPLGLVPGCKREHARARQPLDRQL
eukprot:COSAG04_NODE_14043_length_583_cov_0.733471_2_plen_44_part_01